MPPARRMPALLCLTLSAAACAPNSASVRGREVNDLYEIFFIIAAVIFVGVAGAIAWSIIRFRDRSANVDDELPPQVHTSVRLEILWFAIPTVIVIGLFILSARVLGNVNEPNPASEDRVVVNVTGFQWGWRFTYEDGPTIVSLPQDPAEIHLPTDTPITFVLRSPDVIHNFYVPRFLIKRDVIPGMTNRLDLEIGEPGIFGGVCAEFCGLLHHKMNFNVRAESPEEFASWVSSQMEDEG